MSSDRHAHAGDIESESENESGDGDEDIMTAEIDMADLMETCSEVCEILRSPRRLRVLDILADERRIEKGDLAREIARREGGANDQRDVAADEYRRTNIGLHQNHLPKLEDYGIIAWDHNHVIPGDEFDTYLSAYHALALSQSLPIESDLGGVSDGE